MEKTITKEQVKKVIAECEPADTVSFAWMPDIPDVSVRYTLNRGEEAKCIRSIIECCYDTAGERFTPEFLSLSFMVNIISAYSSIELPDDIDLQHSLLFNTNIFELVLSSVCEKQIKSIASVVSAYTEVSLCHLF